MIEMTTSVTELQDAPDGETDGARKVVELRDISDSPFTDRSVLPVNPVEVEDLRQSIRKTGVWTPLVVRPNPDGSGYELAYGHVRLEAIRGLYGLDREVEVIVRDYSNEQMLRVLVDENRLQRGHTADVIDHAVLQCVRAFGKGTLTFRRPVDKATATSALHDPKSYVLTDDAREFCEEDEGQEDGRGVRRERFTAGQVADYLGIHVDRVKEALQRLELVRKGLLPADATREVKTYHAKLATRQVHRLQEELEAKPAEKTSAEDASAEGPPAPEQAKQAEGPGDVDVKRRTAEYATAVFDLARAPGITGPQLEAQAEELREQALRGEPLDATKPEQPETKPTTDAATPRKTPAKKTTGKASRWLDRIIKEQGCTSLQEAVKAAAETGTEDLASLQEKLKQVVELMQAAEEAIGVELATRKGTQEADALAETTVKGT